MVFRKKQVSARWTALASGVGLILPLVLIFFCFQAVNVYSTDTKSSTVPQLTTRVTDFGKFLNTNYRQDLNLRLENFAKKTGQAIYIVLLDEKHNGSLDDLATTVFITNRLESTGLAGTVLLVISVGDNDVAIVTSDNLRKRFWGIEPFIHSSLVRAKTRDLALEHSVQLILLVLDNWFYQFEAPSSPGLSLVRSPLAEIILLPTAPLIGLMTGIVLAALTSVGRLRWLWRGLVSGLIGSIVGLAIIFFVRQRGGIVPGMFYYGVVISGITSAAVAMLKRFWFADSYKGKKSDAWWSGPIRFYRG